MRQFHATKLLRLEQGVFSGLLQNEYWLDQFNHPVRQPHIWSTVSLESILIQELERCHHWYYGCVLLSGCSRRLYSEFLHWRYLRSTTNDLDSNGLNLSRRKFTDIRFSTRSLDRWPCYNWFRDWHRFQHGADVSIRAVEEGMARPTGLMGDLVHR
jgi:hypothetical protein